MAEVHRKFGQEPPSSAVPPASTSIAVSVAVPVATGAISRALISFGRTLAMARDLLIAAGSQKSVLLVTAVPVEDPCEAVWAVRHGKARGCQNW